MHGPRLAAPCVKKLASWLPAVGLALAGLAAGPSPAPAQAPARPPSLTAEEWRQDVRFLARELERRHKNLFHRVSRPDFERAVADLDAAIPSLQAHQIIVRMRQITSLVGDGHTGLHLPPYFRFFPIALFWFGPDLRVLATGPEYRDAAGTRVVGIGDLDIAEVQARVSTCFPSAQAENDWFVLNSSPAFINRPEVLHAVGVIPDPARARFTFENDEGKRISLELEAVEGQPAQHRRRGVTLPGLVPAAVSPALFRQRPGEPFWFTWLPDSHTVYVNFRSYESLGRNARALFAELDRRPPARLIIDLRQNGGGDFFEGRRHLIEPLKRRPALSQKGRVYVVVGRATYSAAMANATDFRKELGAILVGEPIGERPNSYSENDEMTLPKSRIVVSYSTRYYRFVDQDVPAVMPDVRIDPDWEAFRAGRDHVVEWVLRQGR
jgi:hypothetical protein